MVRVIIDKLDSKEYEHPFDRKALAALESTPGIESLVRKFNQYWNDKVLKIQFTGSNIKVTGNNFPEIYEAFEEVCRVLSVVKKPDLYIRWAYDINALAAGVEQPIIVLNSGAIDLLTRDELIFLIGHEIGHIKSEHVLYHQMAQLLPIIGNLIGSATLGIGNLISTGIQIALLNWMRMSEFTADRAGLLACQDVEAATKAMIKMAGVPIKYFDSIRTEEFIKQAKEFDGYDYDTLDKAAKLMSTMWTDHPWLVMRGAEFYKWIDSGEYDRVLNRESRVMSTAVAEKIFFCFKCGKRCRIGDVYCSKCGHKL